MTHAYLHAVTLSNVLPKRDENGDDYTPYNRLSGGMANADLFYPFGTIGYFVDPTKSKLAPDRRVPCLYLGTEIEIPHALDAETGLPAHHQYQYKVIEWRRLMNSTDIPEPRRTIHAVFMNQEVMPADVTSAFKKYEAELTLRLAPIDNALYAPGEQPHVPRQPMAGARPPPRRADDGRTRSSRGLEESVQPAPTRGGVNNKVMTRDELEEEEEVDDGFARLRAELEKREMEKKKKKMTRGTLSRRGEQRQEPRKGARSYADAVTGNKPGVVTRSRAKAKDAFFIGAAQSVEAAKRENDDNTWQEVDGALQMACISQSQITAENARRDVKASELEDTLGLATSAFQVFELLDGARREKPPRHHEAWDPAIAKEIRTLEEHGVFAVVDRPRGKGVKFETGRTVIRTDSIAGSTRGIDTNVFRDVRRPRYATQGW